nr:hypothetical protein [uncultured Mediterraneibacter sp.]
MEVGRSLVEKIKEIKNCLIYYGNLLKTKSIRKYIIRYDEHTYSDYFCIPRQYCGRKTATADGANEVIYQKILEGKPLMVARYGSTELYNMEIFDLNYKSRYDIAMQTLTVNAGFFPNDIEMARKFTKILKSASHNIDVLAFWNIFREEYYIKHLMSSCVDLIPLRYLEPWFSKKPWTKALEGKKVLVIHPYAETIEQQYKKRCLLFSDPNILPKFQLYTVKAVQSMGGKCEFFDTWFNALDWMIDEALKIDFDIALIGCGAYGMPLAAQLKEYGKQAIHMGGVLQILFGIKGKRWDSDPIVSKLYNDAWVRPSDKDRPKVANQVEGGCYW